MKKNYKFSNKEISSLLKEVIAAMEVKEFNYFKIRAYQNLILVLDSLTMSVHNMWETDRLMEIPGMGIAIKNHLCELFETGKVKEYDAIMGDLPQGMFSLVGMRGIGAKRAFKLATAFNLDDRKDAQEKLKKVALAGEIQNIEGFAEKTEQTILETLSGKKKTKSEKKRILLFRAEQVVERILEYLNKFPEVIKVEVVGSFRRRKATVGDIEFAISTKNFEATTNYFLKYTEISEVLVSGDTRSSVVLGDDMQVDIRVYSPEARGSMLQYFTGSKAHNINLRTYALSKGYSISEYGIKEKSTGKLYEFNDEREFYKFLKLSYIPPEIRQGTNEIKLASDNKLPKLIELQDIVGDLHSHTVLSDGVNTLQEIVTVAVNMGYKYIGITDHAPSVQSRGYDEVAEIINKTRIQIAKLNASQDKIKVLYGYEVNILADATIGMPDDLLNKLDYAIGGIHSAFGQDSGQITERLIAALENPYIDIIAHPSGRLLNKREPCSADWQKVLASAAENNKILEITSQPDRLDLPEDLVKKAVDKAIPIVISTDAHAVNQLNYMKYGIDVARRAWCEKEHIINTMPLNKLLKYFRRNV